MGDRVQYIGSATLAGSDGLAITNPHRGVVQYAGGGDQPKFSVKVGDDVFYQGRQGFSVYFKVQSTPEGYGNFSFVPKNHKNKPKKHQSSQKKKNTKKKKIKKKQKH